jgi:hypothetical protein
MGERCEHMVQLQWRAERVGFIKSRSKFTGKAGLKVDDTIVFTTKDDDFEVDVYRKDSFLARASSVAGSIAMALMLILTVKVLCLFSVYAFVKF